LCCGGALVLPGDDEVLDPDALCKLLAHHRVTIVSTVPALLAGLGGRDDWPPSLRLILSGGEALPAHVAGRMRGTARLVNGYGLTETTVCSTYHAADPASSGASAVPIGRPIINTCVRVLDGELQLLPVGCTGELCVAGAGLARGYWRRPDLTADRFVPDPFGPPGSRMVRTGDQTRWLADATLEYRRRADAQVKIRGFRIELGEVEAQLARHPGVREAFVTSLEQAPDDRRLVAYLVPDAAGAPSRAELHGWLSERLPTFMVPSAFVPLDALPLTPNGKVDTAALPLPDGQALAAAYSPPQSALERRIAAIWQETLKVPQVGLDDNFFELGGNSLLIAQVHRRLRDELGADLTLVDMFKHTTVSALGRRLGKPAGPASSAPALQKEGERRRAALRDRAARARRRSRP
jgi:acyl-CoA synthetase (AMP-forming)/AMP-acid ligase II